MVEIRHDFPRKVREIENTWIPMPDGTRLAARIWLPEDAAADPVPAILEYLPYRKRDGTVERDHLTHPYFAGHGYAGVRVDMRGTGDSEGICKGEYLRQEQDDCLAVIDWIAAQPWCAGKVGMIGISWGGFNGLQVAARRPKALGAVVSICSTDDRYADDIHFMGGAVLTDKLTWGATAFAIANTPPDPAIVGDRWRDMWLERLNGNGLWLVDWFRHQRRDDFYRHGSVCENYADIEVPVYAVGGWADGYTNAVFRMLEHLPGPKKGLIGPWAHKYPHFAKPGPQIGFLQECLRWWDQHLKGIDTGIMDEPLLRSWIQDPAAPDPFPATRPGTWVCDPGWPTAGVGTLAFDLAPGRLQSGASDKMIPISSTQTAGWTAPSWVAYGVLPDGPLDQRGEAGLMTFLDSDPLDAPLDLLGFPVLRAKVRCSAPQGNIAAVLSAVDAEGRASFICHGTLNLTHRDSHANPEPMPVDQWVDITFRLNACGQRVAAGQRLRLQLASAYWPIIWPSDGTADLVLGPGAVLELPVRASGGAEPVAFQAAEGAAPLEAEELEPGDYWRKRSVCFNTGAETFERFTDTGLSLHRHTGLAVRAVNMDTYTIHPDDPHSAKGVCHWVKTYRRGDWTAEIEAEISVSARPGTWEIRADLVARDADGVVLERSWSEDIPRDLV